MPMHCLADNWLFEESGACVEYGLSADNTEVVSVRAREQDTPWMRLPKCALQVEALLDLLTGVVLRDEIHCEKMFSPYWTRFDLKWLDPLLDGGIVVPTRLFTKEGDRESITPQRAAILDHLCWRPDYASLRRQADPFVRRQTAPDLMDHSALFWGTTGYLAASAELGAPYLPHPSRRRLIQDAAFPLLQGDATSAVTDWISSQRTRVMQTLSRDCDQRLVVTRVPPIAIEVIESASSLTTLLLAAIDLRDRYANLREWLGEFQVALDDDPPKILSKRLVLESVARHIESLATGDKSGSTQAAIGVSFVQASIPTPSFNEVRQRFGIRAVLNRLILTRGGEASLRKLLRMFGEERGVIATAVLEHFRTQPA